MCRVTQTLLNSILTRDHGKRLAVIENEVRAINVSPTPLSFLSFMTTRHHTHMCCGQELACRRVMLGRPEGGGLH